MLALLTQLTAFLFLVGILLVIASAVPKFAHKASKLLGYGFLLSTLAVLAMALGAVFLAPQ